MARILQKKLANNTVSKRPPFMGAKKRGGDNKMNKLGTRHMQPEFEHKVLDVKRVARVVAGGRRFNFSVVLVMGNKKGVVGVGLAKASDTALAIEKALRNARKNTLEIFRTEFGSISRSVRAKYNASIVEIRPAPRSGLVAGSVVRNILELAGINNVNAKILSRSRNKLNNARAVIEALRKLSASHPSATGVSQEAKMLDDADPVKSSRI